MADAVHRGADLGAAASIGAYSPVPLMQLPVAVGLLSLGSLLACMIAFVYSILTLRLRPPAPVKPLPSPSFDFVVFDSVVIGLAVGVSLRAVWNRQVHRIVGTGIGLLLAWCLLLLPLDRWTVSLTMMALTFVIETAVVRHYAFAAIFITPLTILLAEAARLGLGSPATLIQARFVDTLLGCAVGLVGGVCLHSPRFRAVVGLLLLRMVPARLRV